MAFCRNRWVSLVNGTGIALYFLSQPKRTPMLPIPRPKRRESKKREAKALDVRGETMGAHCRLKLVGATGRPGTTFFADRFPREFRYAPFFGIDAWLTLEGEQTFSNFSSQASGFQPLNHKKQKCKMFPNNNHVCGAGVWLKWNPQTNLIQQQGPNPPKP